MAECRGKPSVMADYRGLQALHKDKPLYKASKTKLEFAIALNGLPPEEAARTMLAVVLEPMRKQRENFKKLFNPDIPIDSRYN